MIEPARVAPALMVDAVDAYLAREGTAESNWLLRYLCELIGPYRALVDVEDEELAIALGVLGELIAPGPARRAGTLVASWTIWCRRSALPVPSVPGV